ncbi:MAG TPA: ABC transporter permease [Gemmatimonadales bacterium]|jgi:spermidine/putrescine transport system permease protein|nr:ABC transporter permease [Gemmatimonadales bacterium]
MSLASPVAATPTGKQTKRRYREQRSLGDRVLAAVSSLVILFLYLPLAVVVLYSFSAANVAMWPIEGYTLGWYGELAQDKEIQQALRLSVLIGIASATVAVTLGTLAALAIDRFEFPGKAALRYAAVLPITLPGIVTGVAMLSFFSFLTWPMSRWTLIIGHATFCIALVLNTVVARLGQLPRNISEASADLGAPPGRTFWRITFPLIRPAILAGAVLAFTLSFDEVIVSFFLQGREPTLPLLIWGRLRVGLSPEINAVATVIILVSLAGVLLSNRLSKQAALAG